MLLLLIVKVEAKTECKKATHESPLIEGGYLKEILERNSPLCGEILRMEKRPFLGSYKHFQDKGWLQNNRYVSNEKIMTMFLMTLSHNTNRVMKRRFNQSLQIVQFYFHEVLGAMLSFLKK